MKQYQKVKDCYDKSANTYLDQFANELEHKHLDRLLLTTFAQEYGPTGPLLDLGCGPGQTTRFLHDQGLTNLIGIDLSENMIAVAQQAHPDLRFEVGNMMDLPYADQSIGSAISFYGTVHFDYQELELVFNEIHRILKPGGGWLFSIHVGDDTLHTLDFLGHPVDITFRFFDPDRIRGMLLYLGWTIRDAIIRFPYEPVEAEHKRGYFWATKRSHEE